MASSRDCIYGRTIGCILWQRRHDLRWQLEHLGQATGLSMGVIMDAELTGDNPAAVELMCVALGLDVDELLARAAGHCVNRNLEAWDLIVDPNGDGTHSPF